MVLAPAKLGVSDGWWAAALDCLPAQYRTGHFVLLTSGSTGEPKLVVGSKTRAESLARVLHEVQFSSPVAQTICLLPLSYSYAFVNQWVWSSVHGRRLVLTPGFTQPEVVREALARAEQAMLCLVGAQVPLLRRSFPDARFPGVIRLHFAGGRFPQEHLAELTAMFPKAEVFNNYGCAEAMPRLTVRRAETSDSALNVGRALPGIELRATEGDVLLFRSPYRALAVVERGAARVLADDEWIPTGDLGTMEADGSCRLAGRPGDVYKRFGEKISLAQLLGSVQSAWSGSAAFYRTKDKLGEDAHVLVLAPPPTESDVKRILAEMRRSFARPHWPLRIESVEQLPLLPNGKADLRHLEQHGGSVHWAQRY